MLRPTRPDPSCGILPHLHVDFSVQQRPAQLLLLFIGPLEGDATLLDNALGNLHLSLQGLDTPLSVSLGWGSNQCQPAACCFSARRPQLGARTPSRRALLGLSCLTSHSSTHPTLDEAGRWDVSQGCECPADAPTLALPPEISASRCLKCCCCCCAWTGVTKAGAPGDGLDPSIIWSRWLR